MAYFINFEIICSCYHYDVTDGECDSIWDPYPKEMTTETTGLGDVRKVRALADPTQYCLLSLGPRYNTVFSVTETPF